MVWACWYNSSAPRGSFCCCRTQANNARSCARPDRFSASRSSAIASVGSLWLDRSGWIVVPNWPDSPKSPPVSVFHHWNGPVIQPHQKIDARRPFGPDPGTPDLNRFRAASMAARSSCARPRPELLETSSVRHRTDRVARESRQDRAALAIRLWGPIAPAPLVML